MIYLDITCLHKGLKYTHVMPMDRGKNHSAKSVDPNFISDGFLHSMRN